MPISTETKRNLALLDVDNTLVFGDEKTITFNSNLIDTLLESGIRDIFLFTSMRVTTGAVEERQALVRHLREKGFTVHGIITPSDIFWPIEQTLMDDFLQEILNKEDPKALLAQEKYKAITDMTASKPGIAFETGVKSPENAHATQLHSESANNVLGVIHRFKKEYMSDKGYMYDLFVTYKPEWLGKVVFVDDAESNIKAIIQANERHQLPLLTLHNRNDANECNLPKSAYQKLLIGLIKENNKNKLEQKLNGYIEERTKKIQESRFSFASFFQNSLSQEQQAITALETALDGKYVDLMQHLEILRRNPLGSVVREFVKSGAANALCGREVFTVREFINSLHQQVNKANIAIIDTL